MAKEVRFDIAPDDGPRFLSQMGIIDEEDGNIVLAVYKENGIYALARCSKRDFLKSVDLLVGDDRNADDEV